VTAQFDEAVAAFQRSDLDRAHELAQELLSAEPHAPMLEHLMGLIQCRLGKFDRGIEWLRKASDAEPENVGFRVMLARALTDSGRAVEALVAARESSGSSRAELALWHARAEAAASSGDREIAVESWGRITQGNPNDWRAWNNYGDALAALERWGEAAAAFGRAVQLSPADAGLRRRLAAALANGGFVEESVTELEDVIAFDPKDAESPVTLARGLLTLGRNDAALAAADEALRRGVAEDDLDELRGHCLVALRRFDEAEAIYCRILERDPANGRATHELGVILERSNRLEELKKLLSLAVKRGVDESSLAYLRAAMAFRTGKAADAVKLLETYPNAGEPVHMRRLKARAADVLGDSATAFAAAEAMNRAFADYEEWRERGTNYRAELRSIGAVITQEWAHRLIPLPPDDVRPPTFLVGFPRSGTTLLDTFLMGHPQTSVLEEKRLVAAAEKVVGRLADLPRQSSKMLETAREAYRAELHKHVNSAFAGLIIDKLPFNMLGAPLIHAMFPDARFIFAQRHPCDAVLSGFMQSFTPNDAMASFLNIVDAADLYDAAMDLWTRSRDKLGLRSYTIVYEELVRDPESTLKPLIDFLELEWHDQLLDHRSTALLRSAIPTPSYDQVVEPLTLVPSGRWRRYEKQLAPVLPVLLPWAKRLGYSD
jgi:predicted Zn-dependent protease